MKAYCKQCGTATSYNMQKPKFCHNCGTPFSKVLNVSSYKATKTKPTLPTRSDEELSDDLIDSEDYNLPEDINKLEFDMIGSLQVKGTTVGDLAGTLDPNTEFEPRLTPSEQNISEEKFLKDFQREAGTSRPK